MISKTIVPSFQQEILRKEHLYKLCVETKELYKGTLPKNGKRLNKKFEAFSAFHLAYLKKKIDH